MMLKNSNALLTANVDAKSRCATQATTSHLILAIVMWCGDCLTKCLIEALKKKKKKRSDGIKR